MQLQIDVNSVKSTIFLELLQLFKKDNMINDLLQIGETIDDAKNGAGYKTSKIIDSI